MNIGSKLSQLSRELQIKTQLKTIESDYIDEYLQGAAPMVNDSDILQDDILWYCFTMLISATKKN